MNLVGVYHALLDHAWPPRCRLCGGRLQAWPELCLPCQDDLPWLRPGCTRCARPLPAGSAYRICGRCQRRPPAFDRTFAALQYAAPADYLLRRLKFNSDLGMAPLLAALFMTHLDLGAGDYPDALLPVPLHPRRLRTRGFNQATELARPLARRLALPLATSWCRRVRDTQAQSSLRPLARRLNLRRAFRADAVPGGVHVAIVDDVMTTGHTAGELAAELKRAGAGRVDVWVMARTGP